MPCPPVRPPSDGSTPHSLRAPAIAHRAPALWPLRWAVHRPPSFRFCARRTSVVLTCPWLPTSRASQRLTSAYLAFDFFRSLPLAPLSALRCAPPRTKKQEGQRASRWSCWLGPVIPPGHAGSWAGLIAWCAVAFCCRAQHSPSPLASHYPHPVRSYLIAALTASSVPLCAGCASPSP
jgi:hypothetical protein